MECEKCPWHHEENQNAILYTLLSQNLSPNRNSTGFSQKSCMCHKRRMVCLRTPQVTCQVASGVLVKIITVVKNLPSFQLLPWDVQFLLLDSCWAPLFLLGLVQEMVTFEVMETPAPSMLERIILDGPCKKQEPQRTQPTLASVQRLQCCLNSFYSLDLSPKEYAYLKGAILFNPGKSCLNP
ncbi:nuclear receptor subfamily 0 group B member 2-like [Anolis sagrei]|uniref:nuclear receptor subfamily 0 group B member 2-like n=1 Tax=Anolis sagrei TaxID=38937 RepID=UPI003522711B